MLQLIDLHRTYKIGDRQTTPIVRLSLTVEPAEWLTLIAPSGSGKTTLFKLITGQLRPTEGEIIVAGERLSSVPDRGLGNFRSRRLGLVLESDNLIPLLTVRENLELPLRVRRYSLRERRRIGLRALEFVHGLDWYHTRADKLNIMEAQLVALARAIATDPDVLLLDEPTGRLDPGATEHFLGVLAAIHAALGSTVVLLSHDPMTALKATHAKQLVNGRAVDFILPDLSATPPATPRPQP